MVDNMSDILNISFKENPTLWMKGINKEFQLESMTDTVFRIFFLGADNSVKPASSYIDSRGYLTLDAYDVELVQPDGRKQIVIDCESIEGGFFLSANENAVIQFDDSNYNEITGILIVKDISQTFPNITIAVVDEDEAPITNAKVQLSILDEGASQENSDDTERVIETTYTGEDGLSTLTQAVIGNQYWITVSYEDDDDILENNLETCKWQISWEGLLEYEVMLKTASSTYTSDSLDDKTLTYVLSYAEIGESIGVNPTLNIPIGAQFAGVRP